jgi:hypothetical protein
MRGMSTRPAPLLNRLRRHRGLWLLVVAVLLIKLVSGSVCLADGGERDTVSPQAHVAAAMALDAPATEQAGDGACLLGEGASCHCACAHAATLPASVELAIGSHDAPFATAAVDAGRVPEMTGSLLRPPIA